MNEVAIIEPWYTQLVEELKDIIVEGEFAWRWTILETYHAVGKRILAEHENFEHSQIYGERLIATVAESLGRSERTVYYAMKFAETFPSPSEVPEGKNVSWRLVCQKYLTRPKQEAVKGQSRETEEYCLCPKCGSEVMPIMTKCSCGQEFEVTSDKIRRS